MAEKQAKLAAKATKVAAATPAGEKKAKAEKAKKEEEPAFVYTTPKGQKKGSRIPDANCHPYSFRYAQMSPNRWPQATTPSPSSRRGMTGGTRRAISPPSSPKMARSNQRAFS